MWVQSGNKACLSTIPTFLLEKGRGKIPQAVETDAVHWPLPCVLESLVL
jgi:hypothetical protein